MTMDDHLQRLLDKQAKLAASRGFTVEYQHQQEKHENVICHRELAPATQEKYSRAAFNWALWRLSRNEIKESNFAKDEPDPTPQLLKLFAENYIVTRSNLPSQRSACDNVISFISQWERETSRILSEDIKKDVLNHTRTVLTAKYNLLTKPRERFLVTAKDIEYLLRHLFTNDSHDYVHERARVQTASALALFAGSGARAGAIVESSSYRNTNESLYYKHLSFHMKWGNRTGGVQRWVTVDPEFLKGFRHRDDRVMPKNWFREHPILGMGFVFWVIVHGIADNAFKGISSIEELLAARPPKGRESWTLQWTEAARDLPFFRMVTLNGPRADKALTFSSLRHNFTSLAQRDGFKDPLRVHGIRGAVANKIDPRASEATRGQALDHQNPDTYLKYQSSLKALDVQALFYDLEPDYECRDMEQSMAHHRDANAPFYLNAAAQAEFEQDTEVMGLNERIADLTKRIAGMPNTHKTLASERSRLHAKKAKLLQAKRSEFLARWWDACYDEYIAGNEFGERDSTCLFDIYSKYLPERTRLRENLFKKFSLDSDVGRKSLQDMVDICRSTERVVYYPEMSPVDERCPICSRAMSSIALQDRAKHILQCRRKSLNAAPYQQRYKNGKRAHRRINRNFAQFCYLCAQLFHYESSWIEHCQVHLNDLQPRCGLLTFRYTLVAPGFCPFCLSDEMKRPDERFQQWLNKATLLNHIEKHLRLQSEGSISCPHPCCVNRKYKNITFLQRHLSDAHSIEEPRPNCIGRKRRWGLDNGLSKFSESEHQFPDNEDNSGRDISDSANDELVDF